MEIEGMHQPLVRFHEITLTGKIKFRYRRFSHVPILQVEIRGNMSRWPNDKNALMVTRWRDASMEEALALSLKVNENFSE
jgi:hypothetical protein